MKKLSDTQIDVLNKAADRQDGNIEPLPDNINAGIRPRVINGLLNRNLIDNNDGEYTINEAGYDAINRKPSNTPPESAPEAQTSEDSDEADCDQQQKEPRPGSKLAAIVALLKRQKGASIDEMIEATNWQKHTIRGTLSESLKKRYKYNITSDKEEGELRRYFITIDPDKNDDDKNDE